MRGRGREPEGRMAEGGWRISDNCQHDETESNGPLPTNSDLIGVQFTDLRHPPSAIQNDLRTPSKVSRPLSPECRLVFRTADPTCAASEFATLASEVTDWPRVLILAEREMATARLARAVVDTGDGVPGDISQLLRRQALTDELRMQYLSR